MHVTVHYPESVECVQEIKNRIAEQHAKAIINYINRLNCPDMEKYELLSYVRQLSIVKKSG